VQHVQEQQQQQEEQQLSVSLQQGTSAGGLSYQHNHVQVKGAAHSSWQQEQQQQQSPQQVSTELQDNPARQQQHREACVPAAADTCSSAVAAGCGSSRSTAKATPGQLFTLQPRSQLTTCS
jgi:hypothetical protein